MNAELTAVGEERIIIPTVFRTKYVQSLKALSQNNRPEALARVLIYAQRYVSRVEFEDYREAVRQLGMTNAFKDPADAMGMGDRLLIPEGAPRVGWG